VAAAGGLAAVGLVVVGVAVESPGLLAAADSSDLDVDRPRRQVAAVERLPVVQAGCSVL